MTWLIDESRPGLVSRLTTCKDKLEPEDTSGSSRARGCEWRIRRPLQ